MTINDDYDGILYSSGDIENIVITVITVMVYRKEG